MANHALVDLPLAREPAEFAHEVVTVRSVSEFRALRQMWLALTRDAEDALRFGSPSSPRRPTLE